MADRIIDWGIARAGAIAGIALAIGTLACAPPAATTAPVAAVSPTPTSAGQTVKRVRVSVAGALGQAGQYLAQSQGYFAQEGLSVDLVQGDPSNAFTALFAGEVDVSGIPVDSGLFNAIQRGVDFRIAATQASSKQDANGVFFVVRRDLIDNRKVVGYADLKGLKIGIPTRADEYVLAKALQAGGLVLGDAEAVILNFPATVTALGSGAIDVGVLPEPLATIAVQNGSGVKWKGYADVAPGIQQTVVAFSPQFTAQRDVATSWMTAYLRGLRDYNDAFFKNTHRSQTVEALASALSLKPALFDSMGFAHLDPDGRVNMASVEDRMRWYVQMGYVSAPVDLTKVFDSSFADAAVARLGPYR